MAEGPPPDNILEEKAIEANAVPDPRAWGTDAFVGYFAQEHSSGDNDARRHAFLPADTMPDKASEETERSF